ncbi:MAG: hypothetical protein JWR44_2001 [Hymenobacter sp.]|nr:hypothetical protein [Hymenobacter sp.]
MRHDYSYRGELLNYLKSGLLLLALCVGSPAAWGQSFGLVSTYSTGTASDPVSVALGDVNGDGRLDIVTANNNSNAVGVLFGQVGGTFAAAVSYSTGANSIPLDVKLGDVNGDGRLDIVTANQNTSAAGVLLGQVGGTFAAATSYSTGANSLPLNIALGDVNSDGRLDIVATDYDSNAVQVLLGQAGGGFSTAIAYSTGTSNSPQSVALGDVNGDGRPDIVTANTNTNTAAVLLGQAGGTFATAVLCSTGANSSPFSLALGDVNGDGRTDIITANYYVNTAGVLLGQGGGTFAPVASYATGTGSAPINVALGDINGDGRPDIVTANIISGTVGVLNGQAGGTFATAVPYATVANGNPRSVALGDVNGDGRLDIVSVSNRNSTAGVFLNTGTFTPLATASVTTADFSLAPNPAHDTFTVQLLTGFISMQAELLNALGQVVRHPAASSPIFRVETSGLAPGVYTLRLHTGGVALAKRVVVE